MIREYLKLARSFNAALTAISPVMGAISMIIFDPILLLSLFLIGFLGHTWGFVFNDIIDYKIDRGERELNDRPLISGTITMGKAKIFALSALITGITLGFYISYINNTLYPSFIILICSAICVTTYDLISKKIPLTDLIISLGVFLLILYGASIKTNNLSDITPLAWIVCIIGGIQVLFMNIVAGGLKDIENDYRKGANTLAVKLGVRVINKELHVSISYKIIAYTLQLLNITLVFLPFIIIPGFIENRTIAYTQWILLIIVSILMLFLSHKILQTQLFHRDTMRKHIGLHYYTNFALAPIMLMSITPWTIIITIFPALGFILSNLVLHKTLLQPKTM
ncbi:MAG: UbiA family prenyltransferase [Candidatus Thermoplasmatota archaeon]